MLIIVFGQTLIGFGLITQKEQFTSVRQWCLLEKSRGTADRYLRQRLLCAHQR